MKYHHYLYLAKLFDKMEQLPSKPEVKHDEFYGKLILTNKETIKKDDNIIKGEESNEVIEIKNDKIETKKEEEREREKEKEKGNEPMKLKNNRKIIKIKKKEKDDKKNAQIDVVKPDNNDIQSNEIIKQNEVKIANNNIHSNEGDEGNEIIKKDERQTKEDVKINDKSKFGEAKLGGSEANGKKDYNMAHKRIINEYMQRIKKSEFEAKNRVRFNTRKKSKEKTGYFCKMY